MTVSTGEPLRDIDTITYPGCQLSISLKWSDAVANGFSIVRDLIQQASSETYNNTTLSVDITLLISTLISSIHTKPHQINLPYNDDIKIFQN